MIRARSAASAVLGLALLAAAPTASAVRWLGRPAAHVTRPSEVQQMRQVTAKFHDIATAEAAGYVPFTDVNGVSCISDPTMGAMGVHYVNPTLIADPGIRATQPEALVYAPDRDGTLRLAALEYLVPEAAWDAHHPHAPYFFRGHPFTVTAAPNRYGLPTFYSQHVWVWKANPAGLLAMWNPTVNCGWA